MKKNIGAKLALYPTPLVVVGTMVNGKPNWTLVGHLGIIGHDRVMVSMSDSHYGIAQKAFNFACVKSDIRLRIAFEPRWRNSGEALFLPHKQPQTAPGYMENMW